MKKIIILSLAVCLFVSVIGTVSVSALTIGTDWYLDEHFNREQDKGLQVLTSPYAIRKLNDPQQPYNEGSLMIATPADGGNVRVQLHTPNRSGEVLSSSYGSAWWRGLAAGYSNNGFIASSYFYGNPSATPTGSGILKYGKSVDTTADAYKNVYQGARFYEQSFYMSVITLTPMEFRPRLTLSNAPATDINPGELDLRITDGVVYVHDEPADGVDPFVVGNSEDRHWRQVKYVYDFDENKAYLYLDGKLLSTYAPESEIYLVKLIDVLVDGRTSWVLDDYVSDPHGGRALTPFFTDFYVNDIKVQGPEEGSAKAVVKLYKDIPDDYVVIGARYNENKRLVDVKIKTKEDADTVDLSLTIDFGEVAGTDKLMVTAWNALQDLHPLATASSLTSEQPPEPVTGLDGLELHTTKLYDTLSNQGNYDRPSADVVLNDYKASPQYGKHPRIMLTEASVNALKSDVADSGNPKKWWYDKLKSRADQLYNQLTGSSQESYLFSYKKCYETRMPGIGGSGTAADQFKDRMMILGMAYQITGDSKYASAAWVMLDRVAGFDDINPWHDLDFGIFCQGYAIAYDWMYKAWNAQQKSTLEQAIMRQCFRPANDSYTNNNSLPNQTSDNGVVRGVYTSNNHNPIVNAGVVMTSLALMDKYQAITPSLCRDAFICLEKDLNMFAPDGATSEGTEYMLLSADHLAMLFSSLESAIGDLYGLDTCPGLVGGKLMRVIHGMESDVGIFSFGDTNEGFLTYPGELWFDKHYNMTGFRTAIFDRLKSTYPNNYTYNAQILCWYEPDNASSQITLDKDMYIGGDSAFATFRNSFDTQQTFAGVKAGKTVRNYFAHLDQGSFVYHALGAKWAIDLGKDNYNLSGYMQPTASDNRRFKIFRLRADGHNTLLINPSTTDFGYAFDKTASLTTQTSSTQAKAVVDMTNLVSSKASSAKRGFLLTDNRLSLVVRDEVTLKQSSDLYWIMYTPQSVTVSGNTATLKKSEGVQVTLDFASSAAGELYTESAAPWSLAPTVSGQANNSGYTRIVYKITGATGSVDITAKLTPVTAATSSAPGVSTYGSIDSWSVN